jgi:hypothetical protein
MAYSGRGLSGIVPRRIAAKSKIRTLQPTIAKANGLRIKAEELRWINDNLGFSRMSPFQSNYSCPSKYFVDQKYAPL